MAVNESRSMNADLREGLTDGVVKKVAPNRGGVVEVDELKVRTLGWHYGTSVAGPEDAAYQAARTASL